MPEKLAETGVEALELYVTNVFLELVPMSLGIPLEQQAQDMSNGGWGCLQKLPLSAA